MARPFIAGDSPLRAGERIAALVDRQPFGGMRLSGLDARTGGDDYLLQFVESRSITQNTFRW